MEAYQSSSLPSKQLEALESKNPAGEWLVEGREGGRGVEGGRRVEGRREGMSS